MSEGRPDPEVLLARAKEEEEVRRRGRLKIFFGMAPGVGKTYAMLESARKLAKEGADVIIGHIEPHARPETQALVMGLDLLPHRQAAYRGTTIAEFDLAAALARRPQVILVDELAHTNAEGSLHPKRWQDVEDLLAAGIDVHTTLNVQHLESLNDVVADVTAVTVRETVPDHMFERADEVELVDLPPDDLIDRLKEGKVYLPTQAYRAIENFFRKGNLIALRELALRKTAERVGVQADRFRELHALPGGSAVETILVCVGSSPMSARLVRATRRMAAGAQAKWIALHIELQGSGPLTPEERERIDRHLRLAEELGGRVDSVAGGTFAEAVLNYARQHHVTRIVVGKPRSSRWQELWRGSYVYDLIRGCGEIDVYVISGDEESPPARRAVRAARPLSWIPYLWSIATVAACTLICFALDPWLAPTNLAMVYLAGVVWVSLTWGRGPSLVATLLGILVFDLSFIPPYGALLVSDSQYLVTFAVMLGTGWIISALASRVRTQTMLARAREQRTAALLALSKELVELPTHASVAQAAARILGDSLDADVGILLPDKEGNLTNAASDTSFGMTKDQGVARWVFAHRRPGGAGTDTLPGTESTYLPLVVQEQSLGVLAIRPRGEQTILDPRRRQLLDAFALQIAGALERCDLAARGEEIRLQMETEKLKNSLLSAVSHDLRTPLATITGAASVIAESTNSLLAETRKELAESILDESDRLHRLVANLLDMTRIQAGVIQPRREWQPIEEVVGIVLERMARQLRGHSIQIEFKEDLPAVPIDGLLIQQVLVNLLDNAVKFSPLGTTIELRAECSGAFLRFDVADRGPGLPPEEAARIFDKFYRGKGSTVAGTGIGLAICKAIVELHGGTLTVENRADGGSLFRFTLPLDGAIAP